MVLPATLPTAFPTQGDVRDMIADAIGELTGVPARDVDLGNSRVLVLNNERSGYNWSYPDTLVKARFRPFVHRAVSMVRQQYPILR
jgi:hypothetical protein